MLYIFRFSLLMQCLLLFLKSDTRKQTKSSKYVFKFENTENKSHLFKCFISCLCTDDKCDICHLY